MAEVVDARRGAARTLAPAVLWQLTGAIANQGSTLVANIVLANILGASVFGQYALVSSTVVAASQLAQLGLGVTATKYVAQWRLREPQRAGDVIALCCLVGTALAIAATAALALGAGVIARSVMHAPGLAGILAFAAGFVPFAIVNGCLIGALAGLSRFESVGRVLLAAGIAYVTLCVSLGRIFGLNGAIVGVIVSSVFQTVMLVVAVLRSLHAAGMHVRWKRALRESSVLFRFAIPGALGGLTSIPALWFGTALIARHAHGTVEVALYAAAYNLAMLVLFVPNVLNSVVASFLNSRMGAADHGGVQSLYRFNMLVALGLVMLGALFTALLSSPLLSVYGAQFRAARPALLVLLVATIPEICTIAMSQRLQLHSRMWSALFTINIPRDLSIVIAAVLLVQAYGAVGMAFAYLIGRLVGFTASALLLSDTGQRLAFSAGNTTRPA